MFNSGPFSSGSQGSPGSLPPHWEADELSLHLLVSFPDESGFDGVTIPAS